MPPPREKSSNQNINVAVRCRPMNASELADKCHPIIETNTENKTVLVRERAGVGAPSRTFTFDRVFGTRSRQLDVYKAVVEPAIEEVITGYNCTIFAYGQTGTGKTFTMEGERSVEHLRWEDDPMAGIVPRSLAHLFEKLEAMNCEFSMRVSYLELYNEELFDLLGCTESDMKMRIYDDSTRKGSVVIQGLEEVVVRNKHEVYNILKKGSQRRQTASTILNATSSRSHTVFTITIHTRENSVDGEELVRTGKLNLVDLAGSENIGRSGAVDKRAREAGNINQSLLTLGRVITALVDRTPHVPYRESKLTRILQDSLGGKTKTSIIATISPASINFEETLSTLDYAHRAKNIQNKPEINQKLTKKNLMKEYNEEIERLRKDLQSARDKNGIFINEDNYREMQHQLTTQTDMLKTQEEELKYINKEHAELMEIHTGTVNSLKDTQESLQQVTSKLDVVEKTLERTQTRLSKVLRQRDEQTHLLAKHVSNEAAMEEQAQSLLESVELTKSHIAKLQCASERRSLTEKSHFELLSSYQSSFGDNISKSIDSLRQFDKDQVLLFTSSNSLLDELKTTSTNQLTTHTELLSSLRNMLHQELQTLSEHMVKSLDHTSTTAETVKKSSAAIQKCLESSFDDFTNAIISQMQTVLSTKQDKLHSLFMAVRDTNMTLTGQMDELRSRLSSKIENLLKSATADFLELSSQVERILHETEQAVVEQHLKRKSILEKRDDMIVATLQTLLRENSQLLEKEHEGNLEAAKELCKSGVATNNRCQQAVTRLKETVDEVVLEEKSKAQAVLECAKCEAEEHSSAYITTHQEMSECNASIASTVDTNVIQWKEQISKHTSTVTSNLTELTTKTSTLSEETDKAHQAGIKSVDEQVGANTASLTEAKDWIHSQSNKISDVISEQMSSLSSYKERTVTSTNQRSDELNTLIKGELKPYQPSGATPPKMAYKHVEEICRPLVHSQLLETYRFERLNQDEDMAARLALPLTDSEEENEDDSADKNEEAMTTECEEETSDVSKSSVNEAKENIPEDKIDTNGGISVRKRGGGLPRSKGIPTPSSKSELRKPTVSARTASNRNIKRKLPEATSDSKKHLKSSNQ